MVWFNVILLISAIVISLAGIAATISLLRKRNG